MKRFDIITESDARTLEVGSTVALNPAGTITPLAADTLRARRVTVVRNTVDGETLDLAPVAEIRKVALGSDHSGLALKTALRDHLRTRGLMVEDIGTHTPDAVDYPDI